MRVPGARLSGPPAGRADQAESRLRIIGASRNTVWSSSSSRCAVALPCWETKWSSRHGADQGNCGQPHQMHAHSVLGVAGAELESGSVARMPSSSTRRQAPRGVLKMRWLAVLVVASHVGLGDAV